MEPRAPEDPTSKKITLLRGNVIEIPGFGREITVNGDNIGASKWQEMLTGSQTDEKERHLNVFYNPLTKKFTPGNIVIAEKTSFNVGNVPLGFSGIGPRGMLYEHIANVHTHPMTKEDEHLKTTIPSIEDIKNFLNHTYSAGVIIDRGGAHLLVRTYERINEDLPPDDLIKNIIAEVKAKDGITTDVQKQLNSVLSRYGLVYFYTEALTPSEDGTITFKKP